MYIIFLSILTPKSFSIQNWKKKIQKLHIFVYLPKQIISFDYNHLFLW